MLSQQEYCGDVINFKTYSKSYKQKARIPNSQENMAIFRDVHEPIIGRATWEKVQEMQGTRKKRPRIGGEKSIFSGLLKCADCGSNLNFHFNQKNREIKYFNCSNNNSGRGTCSATHYIREDFLHEVVLQEIRRLTRFASRYEDEFAKAVLGYSMQTAESERTRKRKELNGLLARDKELDVLFERIYEDNVTGKITDERFAKMSKKYEQEQGEVAARIRAHDADLRQEGGQLMTADLFLHTVRRYTDAQELTQRMVTEFIDYIDIYHAEKVDGRKTQKIVIHYNCIGPLDVPDLEDIPRADTLLRTRKGVAVGYSS